MSKEILTTSQIAEYCSVTPRTVTEWIKQGRINAFKTLGKHSRVYKEDFISFLKENNFPIPAEFNRPDSRKRILIVDDEKPMVDAIVRALRRNKDYAIETAYQGFEAGTKFTQFKPDLIIMDYRMPFLDGFAVCRNIRKDPENKNVKIMFCSGVLDEGSAGEVLKVGADDYVSKPFSNDELRSKVEKLLEAKS